MSDYSPTGIIRDYYSLAALAKYTKYDYQRTLTQGPTLLWSGSTCFKRLDGFSRQYAANMPHVTLAERLHAALQSDQSDGHDGSVTDSTEQER